MSSPLFLSCLSSRISASAGAPPQAHAELGASAPAHRTLSCYRIINKNLCERALWASLGTVSALSGLAVILATNEQDGPYLWASVSLFAISLVCYTLLLRALFYSGKPNS